MATRVVDTDLDFNGVGKIVRALLNPVSADPGSPANGEVWYNTADSRLKVKTAAGIVSLATTADIVSGAVSGTLWDAESVVVAVADNTPIPQVLAASTVLGRRATGDITAVTYAQLITDLDILAKSLYDANSVVVAVVDNTPIVQTLAASTLVGRRSTGNVTAVTFAQLLTDLQTLGIDAATLGGSTKAFVIDRANHTGFQLAATISDFNAAADARAQAKIDALVAAAPAALDTLNELATALGGDANFATTVNTALAARAKKFAANFGNGVLTSFTVNHALATTDVTISVRLNSTGAMIDASVTVIDANNVTVAVNTVYAANAIRVVVVG